MDEQTPTRSAAAAVWLGLVLTAGLTAAAQDAATVTYVDDTGRVNFATANEPFVPIGLYTWTSSPDVVRKAAEAGFNCVTLMAQGDLASLGAALDEAQRLGVKVLVDFHELYPDAKNPPQAIRQWTTFDDMVNGVVTLYRPHPALLGWSIGWMDPTAPELKARYDQVRALDQDHVCLAAVTDTKVAGGKWGDGADVLATMTSPVPKWPLAGAGHMVRRTLAIAGAERSVWLHLQAYDFGIWDRAHAADYRAPTLDEMRTMALAGLAGGANGVMVFSWDMLHRDRLGFDARWKDVVALVGELNQLLPGLTTPAPPPTLTLQANPPEQLFARAWRRGHILYVAASNGGKSAGSVTFRLPAGAGAPELLAGRAEVPAAGIGLEAGQAAAVRVLLP
ncbi:MAG: hypothetical protein HYU66_24850 [Armatimonadetes bacterium]|nr:hypothetical protein [Armatimonadota bacterium]